MIRWRERAIDGQMYMESDICLTFNLSVSLSLSLSHSLFQSLCLSLSISRTLPFFLSLSLTLSIYLSIYLSIFLSHSLFLSLSFSFDLFFFLLIYFFSHNLAVNTGCPEVLPAKKYIVQYQNGISSVSNAIDGIPNDITVVRHSPFLTI